LKSLKWSKPNLNEGPLLKQSLAIHKALTLTTRMLFLQNSYKMKSMKRLVSRSLN
jgi:hypothetical protein